MAYAAKNLAKKLTSAGTKAEIKDIDPWIRDIISHLWHCVQLCNSKREFEANGMGFYTMWLVCTLGFWEKGIQIVVTTHGEIDEGDNKLKLIQNGPDHQALKRIIWDQKFLKTIVYLLNFHSTAILENFNVCV